MELDTLVCVGFVGRSWQSDYKCCELDELVVLRIRLRRDRGQPGVEMNPVPCTSRARARPPARGERSDWVGLLLVLVLVLTVVLIVLNSIVINKIIIISSSSSSSRSNGRVIRNAPDPFTAAIAVGEMTQCMHACALVREHSRNRVWHVSCACKREGRVLERERERERGRQAETDRDRQRQRGTERDRERQRETERDRERQKETERQRDRDWRDAVRGARWGLEYLDLLRDIWASELTFHMCFTRENVKTCSG